MRDFTRFAGIARPEEFRIVTRAHVIAWRDELARRGLGGATVRHRLASLASLFEHLCDSNARALLTAPQKDGIKSKRDRAILSMGFGEQRNAKAM